MLNSVQHLLVFVNFQQTGKSPQHISSYGGKEMILVNIRADYRKKLHAVRQRFPSAHLAKCYI